MEQKVYPHPEEKKHSHGDSSIGVELLPAEKREYASGYMHFCLYKNPVILTIVTIFLLVCFIITGICGSIRDLDDGQLYVEIASSVIGIILSIMETVLFVVTVRALVHLKQAEEVFKQNKEYVDDGETDVKLSVDIREVSRDAGILLFIGMFLLNATLACVFWGIAIANFEFSPPEVYPYYLVDVLMGVVAPITFVASVYILIAVGSYVMYGNLTPHSMIPAFLSFVKYNKEEQYWRIVKFEYFTFDVRRRGMKFWKNQDGQRRCALPIFNLSTWCLNTMMVVTFCLSITYIVGSLASDEQIIDSCSELEDKEMDCFEHIGYEFVNCSNESLVGQFNCFRFNRIGVNNDPISTVIRALFLYIACDKFLTVLFNFASQLYLIRQTKIWGFFIAGTGFILVSISSSSLILYRVLHSSTFDFLSLLQFFIISMDIFLAGVLLSIVPKRPSKREKKPQKENEVGVNMISMSNTKQN